MSTPKKTAAKKTGKKVPPRGKKPSGAPIQIRMYNVGFGDCFLLRLPAAGGEKKVLVDCGYHTKGKGKFNDRELVAQIKEDLDGAPLDVVVATHRHQDHISGFGETDLWKEIGVREVWLPFTAREPAAGGEVGFAAWGRLTRTASSLVTDAGELTPVALHALAARTPAERDAIAWMVWNARVNAKGIENLLRGMKQPDGKPARRRYLPDGKDYPGSFETPVLPGVTIHVLGPSPDVKYRGNRKAPANWGLSFDGEGSELPLGLRDALPFGPEWRVEVGATTKTPLQPRTLDQVARFNDDLSSVAAAVDGFLNGESLVLVLEIGKARLLLTGDAEVGTWMKILGSPEAKAIAASATFFKLGHHGSHNATPLTFLSEDLAVATPAMMSTQKGAGTYRNNIPRPEILEVIENRHLPFARSDRAADVPTKGPFAVDPRGRWIDCALPC